jgi:hypothetical protein
MVSADPLRGLEVYHELELGGPLDGQVTWPGATKDLVRIHCGACCRRANIGATRKKHAGVGIHPGRGNRRQMVSYRKLGNPLPHGDISASRNTSKPSGRARPTREPRRSRALAIGAVDVYSLLGQRPGKAKMMKSVVILMPSPSSPSPPGPARIACPSRGTAPSRR